MFVLGFFFFNFFLILRVGFLTLSEHFFLGLVQFRLGPNKVIFLGFFQTLIDGLKLLQKEILIFGFFGLGFYFLFSFLQFFFSLVFFDLFEDFLFSLKFGFFFLFFLVSLIFYFFLLGSLYRNSKYSLLGSIRSASQTLSFDIIFIFFLVI